MCVCVCAFVGLDNKLYTMHGTYIKIKIKNIFVIELLCFLWDTAFIFKCSLHELPSVGCEGDRLSVIFRFKEHSY